MSHHFAPVFAAALTLAVPFAPSAVLAQTSDSPVELPVVRVTGDGDSGEDNLFNPVGPPEVTKSSVPLSKTPQSITVVPRFWMRSRRRRWPTR